MAKLIGVFWFFTILLFLLFFFYSYAGAPDELSIGFGQPSGDFISKGTYFYMTIGLFFLVNILVYLASKLIKLRFPGKQLFYYLRQWLRSFAGVTNVFLTVLMLILGLSNSQKSFDLTRYELLIYLGPILLIIWLGLLVFIFIRQGARELVV